MSGAVHSRVELSADRTQAALRLSVQSTSQVLEWSLQASEILHNLRSALDSLVWSLSILDAREPTNPNSIMFPVLERPQDWASKARSLHKTPTAMLERIRTVQPFLLPTPQRSVLYWISRLNNDDKHRAILSLDLRTRRIEIPREVLDTVGTPRHEQLMDPPLLADDELHAIFHFARPLPVDIEWSRAVTEARLLLLRESDAWEVSGLLGICIRSVRDTISWIAGTGPRPPLILQTFERPGQNGDYELITNTLYIDDADRAAAQSR